MTVTGPQLLFISYQLSCRFVHNAVGLCQSVQELMTSDFCLLNCADRVSTFFISSSVQQTSALLCKKVVNYFYCTSVALLILRSSVELQYQISPMLKSLSENLRLFFSSSTHETLEVQPGLKRKRPKEDWDDDDPDVQITRVEKKRRVDPSQSFVSFIRLSATRMANWVRSKSRPEEKTVSGHNDSREPWVTVSSYRNGNTSRLSHINGDDRPSHNHRMNIRHHFSHVVPGKNRDARESRVMPSHRVRCSSSRSSNTSLFGQTKPSTASACIRLQEKEEYQRLIQLQTQRLRAPWQTRVPNPVTTRPMSSVQQSDADAVSISSRSSSGDTSLFGTSNIFSQGKSSNGSHSIPCYKTVANRPSVSTMGRSHLPSERLGRENYEVNLGSLLARQRQRESLRTVEKPGSLPPSTSRTSQGETGGLKQNERSRTSPTIVIDDDDEGSSSASALTVRYESLGPKASASRLSQGEMGGLKQSEKSSTSPTIVIDDDEEGSSSASALTDSKVTVDNASQRSKPEFLNSVYIKDNYLDDFKNSRLMVLEQRQRQIEEADLKAKAYNEKRRAQGIALEKELKYKMRIFDEQPEVCEEIFRESEDEEEEEESLPELTAEMEQTIRAALRPGSPGEVLSDAFRLQITRKDMATLGGLNWLNDEIINFYMNMLMARGEEEGRSQVYAFNTFFYPKIMSGGHSAVKRWTKKVDIFAMHYILIPVHLGMHWCLCIANMKDKVVTYFDSMGGRNIECLEAVRKYINDESVAKKQTPINMSEWSLVTAQDIPQQMNGSDCGMFACKYAEYITRGKEITFSQEDMPYFRRRMVYEILTKKLLQ
ncbi:sentrin-specific protease 1 isoform X1 [Aplysia californica]|uniref:Sentrin-specific protease 1 isoform X1 n=2 Tax=Aplysia californica TaxID=6500 RepID=A0ABM0JPN2_APLCA|nr:sentrin-specific protease 1 isoform X1 [Aplysia californica]